MRGGLVRPRQPGPEVAQCPGPSRYFRQIAAVLYTTHRMNEGAHTERDSGKRHQIRVPGIIYAASSRARPCA